MTETPLERFARAAREAVDRGDYALEADPDPGPSLAANVEDAGGIVAEIKPASPSAGPLEPDLDAGALAAGYGLAGALGVSVLTQPTAFEGSIHDLQAAAQAGPPTLLKDFVVTRDQVQAAARAGAGAVLLIRELHADGHADLPLEKAVDLAHDLGLDVLLEVYDRDGLDEARATDADVVGVNNRDLRDPALPLDTDRAPSLLAEADLDRPAMALSGMETPEDARTQIEAGADAVLVGTALMRTDRPATALRRWVTSL